MIEADILKKIDLSEADTTDLIQKHSRYLESLNPAQYEVVKSSLPSWEQAAAALGHGVTAQDLLSFVKTRGGAANHDGALCICIGHPGPRREK